MKRLFKGGHVIDPASGLNEVFDILVDHQTIASIGKDLSADGVDEVIELPPDHWVIPGLMDVGPTFWDPGYQHRETMATGMAAAMAGGYTTVCLSPQATPWIDTLPGVDYINRLAMETGPLRVYPMASLTRKSDGEQLTDMAQLSQRGAVGFTDGFSGKAPAPSDRLRRGLEYASMLGATVVTMGQDKVLAGQGIMDEGPEATRLGLPGIPRAAENIRIARDIELARLTGGRIHLSQVSTREGIALIRQAKAEGLQVTADTTPYHLVYTVEDMAKTGYDPTWKLESPLRRTEDRQALVEAAKDGTLDMVVSAHRPYSEDEVAVTIDGAPWGCVGLETTLSFMVTHLVKPGILPETTVVALLSLGAARVMRIPGGKLAEGSPADLVIVQTDATWTVKGRQLKSRSANTLLDGEILHSQVVAVWIAGRLVSGQPQWLDDHSLAQPPSLESLGSLYQDMVLASQR